MEGRVSVTVQPDRNGTGWEIAIEPFNTQASAEIVGRQLYRTFPEAELIIKNEKGQIRAKDTWPRSSDPEGTKG